jgi:hypothetical protein
MRYKYSALAVALFVLTKVQAQNETDAYRYSNIQFNGTARYNAMGGAFGALGGDISCMSINPAGIARYTKSDFNFSLLYEDINSSTTFMNNTTLGGKGNLNLGSIGFVGAKKLDDADWRYMHFGVAYNRTTFFHNNFTLSGDNTASSMANVFRGTANGYTTNELADYFPNSAELAYQAYLIDPTDTNATTTSYTDRVPDGMMVNQTRTVTQTGYMSEFVFNFAGNYKDKLYVGGSFGIPGARFHEDFSHTEVLNDPDTLTSLNDFSYTQSLSSRGVGFNMKFGVIYLPVDNVRIGASFLSPNYMSFNDTWSNTLTTHFENGDTFDEKGPLNTYVWRMRTPARLMGSIAVILAKMAAIDVDVEYVDYANMRMKRDWSDQSGYDFSAENKVIRENYKSVVNVRAGAEVRIKPFYIRAGFGMSPSPYVSGITVANASMRTISSGIGIRHKTFSCDLGLNFIKYGQDYYPYDPVLFNRNPGIVVTNIVRTSMTFGWKF